MRAALPSPAELGFPKKFVAWQGDQIEAIDRAVFNPKRFTALAMPTGSGKSVTGIATALLHPKVKRAIYLTSTKGLQDQLSKDFSALGVVDLRGAKNYPCRAVEPGEHLDRYRRSRLYTGCDDGPCRSGVRCNYAPERRHLFDSRPIARPNCAYFGTLYDALGADIVSTNYAKYLADEEFGQGLGHADLLILDEGHDADKELEAFLTIEVTFEDAKYIGTKLLKDTSLPVWRDWAKLHRGRLSPKLEAFNQNPPRDIESMKEYGRLKRIHGTLDRIANIDPLDWLIDLDSSRAKLAPMRVSKYAEKHLFKGTPHVLLMSATMTRKTLTLLGINPDDAQFWEMPSRFPIEHRPIISINTHPPVRVNHHMHETTKWLWLQRIDRIIEPRVALGWNGIIHTVSFARMKELLGMSDHRKRFIVHDSTNTREVIAEFKARPNEGLILVSPSVVTGYDFPDDECRFQIIGKMPIPDMRGPIMSARREIDKDYEGYLAMQKLVQACGRGVRGVNDWCETFIVDDAFADYFLNKNKKHAPKWFKDAIYYLDYFPQPLELVVA